jgi:chemosensory pili system protein ChpA (sensor histidine kinase/response regulator)
MTKDKELEIQMQFLEEATDYLNTLEGILLEIDNNKRIELEHINAAMRAAHSIKGGAAMMGFRVLSDLAHRLEDAFKVLKTQKNSLEFDTHLQSLLLSAVDWLRQIVGLVKFISVLVNLHQKILQLYYHQKMVKNLSLYYLKRKLKNI